MKGISILVPTLNEEDAIYGVVRALPEKILGLPVEVVVIDGNSRDGTQREARRAGAKVIAQKSKGKGAAIMEALPHLKYDVIAMVDGDGTYDTSVLPQLVRPVLRDEADMVVGTRLEQRQKSSIPKFNVLGNFIFNWLIRFFYRKNITDMLSGYRIMKKQTLEDLNLVTKEFEIETEITIEALRNNLRILEIPTRYSVRKGESKLHPFRDGLRIGKTLILMVRDTKPLYFFGMASLFFFLFTLWPASLVIHEKLTFGEVRHVPSTVLATASFLVGSLLLSVGLLADMNLRLNNRLENLLKKRK
ncbi:glycosyltransferase [Candidatus Micrarchaeota archaeon]|nr:glycosyltransferase [Candidatus Micrarchaeota archaeon]